MAIHWRLKTYLATRHGIFSATDLQKLVVKKTGVLISLQNLCNSLNSKPKMIRLKTIELICSALECELHAFCEVKPNESQPSKSVRKLSHCNTPLAKRAVHAFPDPGEY